MTAKLKQIVFELNKFLLYRSQVISALQGFPGTLFRGRKEWICLKQSLFIVLAQTLVLFSGQAYAQFSSPEIGALNIRPGVTVLFRSTLGPLNDSFGYLEPIGNEIYRYTQPCENQPTVNLIRSSLWALAITSESNPEDCEPLVQDLGHYGYPGLWMASELEPTSSEREVCWKRKPLIPPGEGDHPQLRPGRTCEAGGRNSQFEIRVYEMREVVGSVTLSAKASAKLYELFGIELSAGTVVQIYARKRYRTHTFIQDCYTCDNGQLKYVGSYVMTLKCFVVKYEPHWACRLRELGLLPLEWICNQIYTESQCSAFGRWCGCPNSDLNYPKEMKVKCGHYTDLFF